MVALSCRRSAGCEVFRGLVSIGCGPTRRSRCTSRRTALGSGYWPGARASASHLPMEPCWRRAHESPFHGGASCWSGRRSSTAPRCSQRGWYVYGLGGRTKKLFRRRPQHESRPVGCSLTLGRCRVAVRCQCVAPAGSAAPYSGSGGGLSALGWRGNSASSRRALLPSCIWNSAWLRLAPSQSR